MITKLQEDFSNPLISILIPVKNAEKWLEECFLSILNQTYTHWEVWAINDSSTDNSASILAHFSSQDSRIKWQNNMGNGIIDALSTAYQRCRGQLIHRMDADDKMPEKKLETLLELLVKKPTAIATGKVAYFGRNPISDGYLAYQHWINQRCEKKDHHDWMYRECVIASPNWLVHRNLIEEIGGFEALNYPEDYDLVLKWLNAKKEVVSSTEVTHYWRDHSYRTSRNSEVYDQSSFFQLKLDYWIKNKLKKSGTVVVLGENQKAEKVKSFLSNHSIRFRWLGIQGKATEEFSALENIESAQVLVCVYPPQPAFSALDNALQSYHLQHGKSYWFL